MFQKSLEVLRSRVLNAFELLISFIDAIGKCLDNEEDSLQTDTGFGSNLQGSRYVEDFIGFDERQRVSFTTLSASIYEHSSEPISITPLVLRTLPITRRGLTPFTFSRFLVPWLCGFEGKAVFLDADMLLVSDIHEAAREIEPGHAVAVVKSIAKFEQTSFMVFDCEHPANKSLTP